MRGVDWSALLVLALAMGISGGLANWAALAWRSPPLSGRARVRRAVGLGVSLFVGAVVVGFLVAVFR